MARANALVGRWMAEAGMAVRVDAAGNLVGHLPGSDPEAGTLLLGSHLDTVRDAGAFDGPLGVLAAIECVARLRAEDVGLPFSVDVLGFSDEEGLRFGTAYLGSRAVAGTLGPETFGVADADGVSVREALAAFGAGPDAAARRGEQLLGYVELHIEQGPLLEQRGAPVGVVTAIAGRARLRAEDVRLPFAVDVLGFSRRGGAALRHRVPRQPRGRRHARCRRCSSCADADGVTVGEALRAFGGDPDARVAAAASACSATASSTSSRARCSSSATRRSASSARSPARRAREVAVHGPGRPRRHRADGAAARRGLRARRARARGRGRRARASRGWSRRSAGSRRCPARRT